MISLDLQINTMTLIKFFVKFVIIIILIWLAAVITPKLSKKTDKTLEKAKKNKKNNSSTEENIYKTDVFGASYENTDKKNEKNEEK